MKYDDSEAYFLNFETDLPNECGATHIGMYLAWLASRDLVGDALRPFVRAVKDRELTGRTLLVDQCDGQLHDDMLSARGNAFTAWYYDAHYLADYAAALRPRAVPDGLFLFEDDWANYRRVADQLDKRFREWQTVVQRVADDLPDCRTVADRLQNALWPLLAAEGMAKDPTAKATCTTTVEERVFSAEFPGGHHRIELRVVDSRPAAVSFYLHLSSRTDILAQAVSTAWCAAGFEGEEPLPCTAHLGQREWLGSVEGAYVPPWGSSYYEVMTADELDAAVASLAAHARERIPLMLRQLETLEGLDALFNAQPMSASLLFSGYVRLEPLLVAHAVGNPRLGALCDEVEAGLSKVDPHWYNGGVEAVRNLIHMLRPNAAGVSRVDEFVE